MTVYKRGGVWWAEFVVDGNRHRFSTDVSTERSRREAERVERNERAKIEASSHRRTNREYRLSEACALWLSEHGGRLVQGDQLEAQLVRMVALFDGDPLLSEIDGAALATAMARRRMDTKPNGKPITEATVNRTVRELLRRVLFYMRDVHETPIKPLPFKRLRGTEAVGGGRELRQEEEVALWAGLREDYHDFVEFALLTGLRRGEALVRWAQYKPREGVMTVRVQKRKPGATPEFRDVVLGPRTIAIVEAQRGFHDEFVFTYEARRRGTQQPTGERRPITASGVDMIFKRERFRSRVKGFRFHDLRHTAGSRIVRATRDINLAKDRLGHSSIAVTAKFYAHVLPGDRLRAAEALEDNLAVRPSTQPGSSPHKIPHTAQAKTRKSKGGKG